MIAHRPAGLSALKKVEQLKSRVSPRAASGRRSLQRGSMMVEVTLALLISSLVAAGTVREMLRSQALRAADAEADTLVLYRQALQDYVDENYVALQFGGPVTRNGTTLTSGSTPGQTMQPSVADLRNLGYLNPGFADVTLAVDSGAYRNTIEQRPVGCAGIACNIVGLAYIDAPITVKGTGGNTDSVLLGQMLNRLGGVGGISVEGSAANITGAGAAWTWPNPVVGAPAGVVAARFGFGSSTLAGYVRMNESRDLNFRSGLTVSGAATIDNDLTVNGQGTFAGNVSLARSLSVAGDIEARRINASQTIMANGQITSSSAVAATDTAGCSRASIESAGDIVSRTADCAVRVRASNAGLTVNDAGGVSRIELDASTAVLALNTAAGARNIALEGATGRVAAQRLRPTVRAVAGAACMDDDDLVADADASGTILVCKGGFWRSPGLPEAVAGSSCAALGALARDATQQALICRVIGAEANWVLLNDRVTPVVVADMWSANGIANVPQPPCGPGGTADIAVAALQGGADYGTLPPRNRFEVRVSGSGPWTVTPALVDESGNAYTTNASGANYDLGWTATTFCRYAG